MDPLAFVTLFVALGMETMGRAFNRARRPVGAHLWLERCWLCRRFAKLQLHQGIKPAFMIPQLVVRTCLHGLAVLDDDYLVGASHRMQSVGDDKRGSAFANSRDRVIHFALGL
jgi:hypothetical protein